MTDAAPAVGSGLSTAEIIAVGSELLTPFRIDTNSLFLTARLNDVGIVVRRKSIVGDSPTDLATAIGEALARVDMLVVCGGLGPTDDDLTRETVAEVLGLSLREDPGILEWLSGRFSARGWTMPEN
ncbi:MAG: molybdopterin-binding protein, partial [Vicinamibacterales bacterium]|nr:molybdopterin-binding protein [Vicinamibacterales bacterium]